MEKKLGMINIYTGRLESDDDGIITINPTKKSIKMLDGIMNKIGYVSTYEAEKFDFILTYKVNNKWYRRKIVDYFNDDGMAFVSRTGEFFTLDDENIQDIKVMKYNYQVIRNHDAYRMTLKHTDKLELMIYLYADIVENRPKIDDYLYKDVVTKFKMATSYNPKRNDEDIDNAIEFMKNDVWVDLYDKAYDDFK